MRDLVTIMDFLAHWSSILFYLFAASNLLRVRKDLDPKIFWVFMIGIVSTVTGLILILNELEARPFFLPLGHFVGALAYLFISKHLKNEHFTFFNQIRHSFNKIEDSIITSFSKKTTEAESISYETLDTLEYGVIYPVDNGKVQFVRKKDPFGNPFYEVVMMAGASFSMHNHNCWESCIIDQGSLIVPEKEGKKIYSVGEEVLFAPNENHTPKCKVFTRLRAYHSLKKF